jgi:hypothetical protein
MQFISEVNANIKRKREYLSHKGIGNYFSNSATSFVDMPACNIFNKDEINLSDDLGKSRLIRVGLKIS